MQSKELTAYNLNNTKNITFIYNHITKTNMTKKRSLLFFFAAIFCGTSAYAAPVEGKTFTNVDHLGAYPTPQNMTASLSGNQIVLQ